MICPQNNASGCPHTRREPGEGPADHTRSDFTAREELRHAASGVRGRPPQTLGEPIRPVGGKRMPPRRPPAPSPCRSPVPAGHCWLDGRLICIDRQPAGNCFSAAVERAEGLEAQHLPGGRPERLRFLRANRWGKKRCIPRPEISWRKCNLRRSRCIRL